jgi:hypothetical protein
LVAILGDPVIPAGILPKPDKFSRTITVQRSTMSPHYDNPSKFWGPNGDISIIWRIRELSVPVNKLVCTCRSVRRAAQEEQRINKLYVLTPLSREVKLLLVMPSRDIHIVNG